MLDAMAAIMITIGMLMTNEMSVAVTMSAPGNAESAKNTPQASVAPTGAENTALNTIASNALASRTRPVLLRTKSCCSPRIGAVAMGHLLTPERAPETMAQAMARLTGLNNSDKRCVCISLMQRVKVCDIGQAGT